MAYHLSQEARAGLAEFHIADDFDKKLFEFQKAAVKIAARYLDKRGGVLIGDVVGLGKTLMATALAKIFEDDYGLESLIICPKNLVRMWEDYRNQYNLHAKVLSLSRVTQDLPNLRRYRLVIIDESHNLRNREGKRYRAIQEYVRENESKCILLSATPYNKNYLDLSNQLRLFVPEDKDIGIRPERLLRQLGEAEFIRLYQCPLRSLVAFEKSDYADDWRELMRLYLIRRTRGFIQDHYAETDPTTGRKFLTFEDGSLSYFPVRQPKTVKFNIDESNPSDQYAKLYAPEIIDAVNALNLPRYGLGNYVDPSQYESLTTDEEKILKDLSRAGKRLMGFCRTNLFKRLESSGQAFIQSIERHILRNDVFLYAIEHRLPVPIGTQDSGMLDTRIYDDDIDAIGFNTSIFEDTDNNEGKTNETTELYPEIDFKCRVHEIYTEYSTKYKSSFKWLPSSLFTRKLADDLRSDINALLKILNTCGEWETSKDTKLDALLRLLMKDHPNEQVIIFTQFADTVRYLEAQLKARGVTRLAGVTGASSDPTDLAWRFSPLSNNKRDQIKTKNELRILITTDILSEGQNLQDCSIIVNYDLPWAIIRLIQRAGRVDRIGQIAKRVICYSFLPADGVERIIRLRTRVRQRLHENAEIVGADEAFFEDDNNEQLVLDLYNERAGILEDDDKEVDLASYAYQIWKKAITDNPHLEKIIPKLPSVVYSTRTYQSNKKEPEGVLVYLRTSEDNDSLVWIDKSGESITESQFAILKAAECLPDTPALSRMENHHELVKLGVKLIVKEEKFIGGQLGRKSGVRFRIYTKLKWYAEKVKGTLIDSHELREAVEELYRYPLCQYAIDTINQQLRGGISDEALAQLVITLRNDKHLCLIHKEEQEQEPRIICSMGLLATQEGK